MRKVIIPLIGVALISGCATVEDVSNQGLCLGAGYHYARGNASMVDQASQEFDKRVKSGRMTKREAESCPLYIRQGAMAVQKCYTYQTQDEINFCLTGAWFAIQ